MRRQVFPQPPSPTLKRCRSGGQERLGQIDGSGYWGIGRGTYDDEFLLEVWPAVVLLAGCGSAMLVVAAAVERVGRTGGGHLTGFYKTQTRRVP